MPKEKTDVTINLGKPDNARSRSRSRGASGNRGRSKSKSKPRENAGNGGGHPAKKSERKKQNKSVKNGASSSRRSRSRSRGRNAPRLDAPMKTVPPLQRDLDFVPPNSVPLAIGVASPTVYTSVFSRVCALIVAKLDSISPQWFGLSGAAVVKPTPQVTKLCLMAIVFSYFKRVGIFTDAGLNASIDEIDSDVKVPVALAALLQQFAPYTSPEGIHFEFFDKATALPGVGATAHLSTAAADMSYGPVNVYPTALGLGEIINSTASTAVASWTAVFGFTPAVMELLYASGIQCTTYGKISGRAPDASAYCGADSTLLQVACASVHFDAEVATFLAPTVATLSTNYCTNLQPMRIPTSVGTARGLLTFNNAGQTNGNLLVGWVEAFQLCPYIHGGTVKSMLNLCRMGPLTCFGSEVIDMNLKNWHLFLAMEAFREIQDGAITSGADLYAFVVAIESALIARLGEYAYLIAPNSNRNWDNGYRSIPLQPFFALFLGLLGPVIHRGRLRLIVPYRTSTFSFLSPSITTTGYTGATISLWQGIFNTTFASAPDYNLMGKTISAGNYTGSADLYPLTPIYLSPSFVNCYNNLYSSTSADKFRGVIPDANRPVGSIANLAFVSYGGSQWNGGYVLIDTTVQLMPYLYPVTGLCADVSHSKADVNLSMFMGIASCPADVSFVSYQTKSLNESNIVASVVAASRSNDLSDTLSYVRSYAAKLSSYRGQDFDPDLKGNAMFAALASVAIPVLAGMAPTVIGHLKKQISNPAVQRTVFSTLARPLLGRNSKKVDSFLEKMEGGYNIAQRTQDPDELEMHRSGRREYRRDY